MLWGLVGNRRASLPVKLVYYCSNVTFAHGLQLSSILAHRGWFLEPSEKNSPIALERAIQSGFGLETDVRDLNRRLIISHDPPQDSSELLDLDWLFSLIHSTGSKGRVALNIKADGLLPLLLPLQQSSCVEADQVFAFDMSVPDAISYLGSGIPAYSRISEYEQLPCFIDQVRGVWVDNFTGVFPQVRRASDLMEQGIRAAIVSSELHRRDPLPLWNEIIESRIYENPLFELCTDLPSQAAEMFC
jgi:hypothetical protein